MNTPDAYPLETAIYWAVGAAVVLLLLSLGLRELPAIRRYLRMKRL